MDQNNPYGGDLNRLTKYTLIVFVAFNLLGGTFLGLHEYSQDKEAKKAFADFYKTAEVKGAYDSKIKQSSPNYLLGGVLILSIMAVGGITYSLIKWKMVEGSKKTSFDTIVKKTQLINIKKVNNGRNKKIC